jgi:hypothetical protein
MAGIRGTAVVRRVKEPVPGADGLSIVWKGDLAIPPANPIKNWVYRNTGDKKVYIYNGTAWQIMIVDGNDGIPGTDGSNGLSVFITYHDNAPSSPPALPTGDGTTGGWHTNTTPNVIWISQKVAASYSSGTWGDPICIKGNSGEPGPVGPLLVSRGAYDANAIYYGYSSRIDAVFYNGIFYRTKITAGLFQGIIPTNTTKWESFDQQIDFLATKIFLSEAAFVHNLIAEQLKTAINGARIEVNAGDEQKVAIYDSDNNLKVLIKPTPVSSKAVIQAGASSSSLTPTGTDMGSLTSSWNYPDFGSWSGSQYSSSFQTSFEGVLEIEVSNIQVSASVSDGYYARSVANIAVVLQKSVSSAWQDVGIIGETNEVAGVKNISATIRGLTAGTYRLAALHSHFSYSEQQGDQQMSDSTSATTDWNYITGSSFIITVRKIIAQTEIGTDGIVSAWSSNKYMHFSQNGFFLKMGTIEFEVTESGVKINGVTHS